MLTRREALQASALGLVSASIALKNSAHGAESAPQELRIDLRPAFELSPYLYMQFMEPLGATDGSVEAAWNHDAQAWREDVVETTRELEPTMLRWGGIYTDFYRWREGVGPRDQRPTMVNQMWGGIESNQVGTAEFCEFARRIHAETLMCVNFESDGREQYATYHGKSRTGDAREAAEWVAYCNDPENAERRGHGHQDPFNVQFWQLGNETSYDNRGFDLDTTIRKTNEFARAMRDVDPKIKLIAWGDSGWASRMADETGDQVDLLAFHHMFNPDRRDEPVLEGERYRRDPAATWATLMDAWKHNDEKIRSVRASLDGRQIPLAMTECHFAIPGRNRCDVLSTWAAGVSYGRILNNHQRHGDVLRIATSADFCGTRWQVNAVMIPTPHGKAYLQPVARVMRLYRHHIGKHALAVESCPAELDVVASRTDNKLFLHVVNTQQSAAADLGLNLGDAKIAAATSFEIADDPMVEVSDLNDAKVMQIRQRTLGKDGRWSIPPASVSAIEVELAA
ncbi:MAG: alpha-L-arabinofuranosidase C-terminal domain-containing protein [Pirellulales bacterium]